MCISRGSDMVECGTLMPCAGLSYRLIPALFHHYYLVVDAFYRFNDNASYTTTSSAESDIPPK